MASPQSFASTAEAARVSRDSSSALGRNARRILLRARLLFQVAGPYVRRSLDIAATGAGLLCLAPLLLIVAALIKLTSEGPVFFPQERVGEHGRRFKMWKFRTMITNAEALKDLLAKQHASATDGVRFKMIRDPRITPVGRVLRKFSMDELPQLFNVFAGDMTLLGPRPPVWREVALYDNRAMRRLEVKPGLTCLWQVRGRSNLSFEQQVDLDIEYIDRVKPAEEVRILLQTVPAVVTGRGAY